uniref:Methyltransf_21 domain-containing protein n=1 Tax=Steinernema glaseri TaxID=37863 RepID=A0A1I7Z202_9BILA
MLGSTTKNIVIEDVAEDGKTATRLQPLLTRSHIHTVVRVNLESTTVHHSQKTLHYLSLLCGWYNFPSFDRRNAPKYMGNGK